MRSPPGKDTIQKVRAVYRLRDSNRRSGPEGDGGSDVCVPGPGVKGH